ncbi:MAG TPA: response regulator [Rhodopila sp.]|nr:response regulator [Rhodopila sp.]
MPAVLFGSFAWYDYRVEQHRALDSLDSTADALAEHAQAILETADLVLARVLDHTQAQDWDTISHSVETHAFLLSLRQELPQLESVFLVSPQGMNVATSRQFPAQPISDKDRDYYILARAGEQNTYVSSSFRGRIADTYAFTITRPRLRADMFDGLAGVTISPHYFQGFYGAVLKHPRQAAAALVRDDGAMLARFPDGDFAPRLTAASPLLKAIRAGEDRGRLVNAFGRGADRGITAFRRLQGWPMVVTYTMDEAFYLHDWYFHVILFAISASLVGLALLWAEKVMLKTSRQEHQVLLRLVDETRRRQQAETALLQAQKLEALGRVTGGVAHDFNNLLAAIMGSLEMLQKHVTAPRQSRLIATARKAAERGAQLTGQMLAFSRHKEMVIRPVDAAAAIHGLDHLLRQSIGPSVSIEYRMDDETCMAMADQTQLEVALLNLAVNARDAMQDGGTLTLGCRRLTLPADSEREPSLPAGAYVEIVVQDTGSGMPEEVRLRVFEPFFTTKGPSKGTGLGLSMVFGFATMSGGTATVESAPGAGTTVRIFLPAAIAQTMPGEDRAAVDPDPARDAQNDQRILLVDDDTDVRSTIHAMLEDLGYTVVVAEDALAALARLENDRTFDLLVVDFAMPDMNGSQLAAAIRAQWLEAPLMFVTGYVENDALLPWRTQGVMTLSKPFTQPELANTVRQAIERQTAGRRLRNPAQPNAANNSSSAFS